MNESARLCRMTSDTLNPSNKDAEADTASRTDIQPRVIQRRNRAKKSCKPCADRHVKCNLMVPCFSCIQRNEQKLCLVDSPTLKKRQRPPANKETESMSIDRPPRAIHKQDSRHNLGPPSHVVDAHSLPSTSPFMRFLDECGTSLQTNGADPTPSHSSSMYPPEAIRELKIAQSALPRRAANTIQMLRRCMTLSAWVGCSSDAARQVGLHNSDLSAIFGVKNRERTSISSRGYDTLTSELYPSMHNKGDAARLSLIIAMCLSAVSMSSVRLARLSYEEISLSGSNLASDYHRHKEESLEHALSTTMRISKQYDQDDLDNTIRAGLLNFYHVKSKGRVEHAASKAFMVNLAEMVRTAGLHRLDAESASNYSDPSMLKARRILFYEYLLHDRMAAAVFGRPAKFLPQEVTTLAPTSSAQTITLLFRTEMATTLMSARDIFQSGASSYAQIERIDVQFVSAWEQICKEYGGIKEASCGRERRWLTEACLHQVVYCTCRVMMHRLCFFNAPSHFTCTSIWESRRICFEAATMAVEMQETMRYTMDSDDLMASFYVAWIPTEHVITLLLASLMALRETLADHRRFNDDGTRLDAIHESIDMLERAKKLASRIRKVLQSAPEHSLLAQKGLMMLDRVEGKADAILSTEIAAYRGETSPMTNGSAGSNILGTEIPFYASNNGTTTQSTPLNTSDGQSNSNQQDTSPTSFDSSTYTEMLLPLAPQATTQAASSIDDFMMPSTENDDIDAIFWNALQQGTIESTFGQSIDDHALIPSPDHTLIIHNTHSGAIEAELDSWMAMLK